ncbi:hypothetical protein DVH05_007045 [Phytophthora capsici]|nr:hypothetical protein DVH05_007045 [Phytophthora capsici]
MSVGFRRQLAHLCCERAERQTGVVRLALHQLPIELLRSFRVPTLHERSPSAVQRLRGHGGGHRGRLAIHRRDNSFISASPDEFTTALQSCSAQRSSTSSYVDSRSSSAACVAPRSAPAAYSIPVPAFRQDPN